MRPEVFPKPTSSDQSQPTSSENANYYAARCEIGLCKYMSQKTIAFWAMTRSQKTIIFFLRRKKEISRKKQESWHLLFCSLLFREQASFTGIIRISAHSFRIEEDLLNAKSVGEKAYNFLCSRHILLKRHTPLSFRTLGAL